MNHPAPRRSLSERAFDRLIAIFPREFRDRFGDDMRDLFRDQIDFARERSGPFGIARLWVNTTVSVMIAAVHEHRDARRAVNTAQSTPAGGFEMLDHVKSDLRFAARSLRKTPAFTIVAVLAISLGSGAVTTIFSAMNTLVLRPPPGVDANAQIVGMDLTRRNGDIEGSSTYDLFDHLRSRSTTMSGVAAWAKATFSIATGTEGNVAAGNLVSANYFSVLGVHPAVGRFFLPEENATPLAYPVVVVSHSFWTLHLRGDTSAVGRPISLNGNAYTLIGVAPPEFHGTIAVLPIDAWVPLMMVPQLRPEQNLTTSRFVRLFGRVKSDASLSAAQSELGTLVAAFARERAATASGNPVTGIRVASLRGMPEDIRGKFFGFMSLLLGAAAIVLLIASVNVASLLSARAVARRREMALRAALGAARSRLMGQLLTEVLLLFILGAVGGIAFAFAATRAAMLAPLPTDIIMTPDMSPDIRVMAFALLVSLVTGLVFGLAPALRVSRDDISQRLRNDSAGGGSRRSISSNAVIVGQLALSLVLLVAAGLFLRALSIGARIDPGFERAGVAIASFDAHSWGNDDTKARRFFHDLTSRVSSLPGVTSATTASFAPLTTRSANDSVIFDSGEHAFVWQTTVAGDYFATLRIPIVAGRAIVETDDEHSIKVAVVNETLAKRLAPTGNAIGRTFTIGGDRVTVVGIARDAKYADLTETTPPLAYFSLDQFWQPNQTLLIRSSAPLATLSAGVRDAIHGIDPSLPRPALTTLETATGITLMPQRIASIVTGALGGVGLMLATLGLYGIIAYSVNRRTREMGVRLALGARQQDVLSLVLGEGLRLALAGVAVGVVLAAGVTRLISGFLFDISALDGITFAGMSLLFMAVAALATYLPARRAARLDPVTALRSE